MNTQFNNPISYNAHLQNRASELLEQFRLQVAATVAREGTYRISSIVFICGVNEKEFIFTGHNWSSHFAMAFADILRMNELGIRDREGARNHPLIPARAKLQATYYIAMLHDFRNFMEMAGAFKKAVRVFSASC